MTYVWHISDLSLTSQKTIKTNKKWRSKISQRLVKDKLYMTYLWLIFDFSLTYVWPVLDFFVVHFCWIQHHLFWESMSKKYMHIRTRLLFLTPPCAPRIPWGAPKPSLIHAEPAQHSQAILRRLREPSPPPPSPLTFFISSSSSSRGSVNFTTTGLSLVYWSKHSAKQLSYQCMGFLISQYSVPSSAVHRLVVNSWISEPVVFQAT